MTRKIAQAFLALALALTLSVAVESGAQAATHVPASAATCTNPDEHTGWLTGPGSVWESNMWVYPAAATTRTTNTWCAVADVRDLVFSGTTTQLRLDVWPGGGTGFTSFQSWVTCPKSTAWCRVSGTVPFANEYRIVSKVPITDGHVREAS